MTHNIDALTLSTLGLAMDAAQLRQQAIASNIANHATEGYLPRKLDFAGRMKDALRVLEMQPGRADAAAEAAAQLRLELVLDAQGAPAPVHLDAEMADMANNSVQYQALVRALSRQLSILHSAVSDGKR